MDVTKLFERGKEAFERGNWGLVVMVWQQLLAMQPDHLDARRLLREAENRKWAQEGRGATARVLAFVKGLGGLLGFVIHMARKNYDLAMIDTEKVLAHDPNCRPMLWGLAAAATKGGHVDVAVVTTEYLRQWNPNSSKPLRRLGYLYEEKDDIGRAIDAWSKLKSIVPNDREAETKLRDLAAVKTMTDGKYETATQKGSTYRESLKSKEDSEEMEEEHRIIRTEEDVRRAIERVEKDVEQNPNNKGYLLQLGDLYRRAKNRQKARELYNRAQKIDQMDFSIPERLGQLRIEEYTERENTLAKKVEASPDDAEAKSELEDMRKEKFDFCLNEYQRQVQVRPTDAGLRAKLGDLLYSVRNFDEAAREYQRASVDPSMKRRCRKLMALCLYNTGKYQLAASQFEQAIEGSTAGNREVREIMYHLAVTLEKLGEFTRAEEALRKIFDADMSYKDVQERLDRVMQAKQEQGGAKPQDSGAGENA